MSRKTHSQSRRASLTSFDSLVQSYLSKLQVEYEKAQSTGESTPELSYRPVLDSFFAALTQSIDVEIDRTFEPRKQAAAGRPDWRFHNNRHFGLYGYVEAKGLDTSLGIKAAQHKTQLEKYLKLGANVVLTDGIEFIFHYASGDKKKISLTDKPLAKTNWGHLKINPLIEVDFRKFFSVAGSRTVTEDGLVKEVAKRAVEMASSVKELSTLSPGEGFDATEEHAIRALTELKSLLESHHDPQINKSEIFSDFVAQVLAFGLLYAHRMVADELDTPLERYRKIKKFWTDSAYEGFTGRLRPFRAIVESLGDELKATARLGIWYQDCLQLLAHVKLERQQRSSPEYHALYETFLNAFSPDVKFDFGTYITPTELSGYTVALVKSVVEEELADINLYASENRFIDPCCGTGTFLEQVIEQANDRDDLPITTGLEILPAPYALTHLRLAMLWTKKKLPRNIEILLTNTLSDELEKSQSGATNLIIKEQNVARKRSRRPLTLVIGNPPSSEKYAHATGENFEIINELIEDFRPPEEKRRDRQNTQKQLNNPFVKFLRWSCSKLAGTRPGILALVLPASFGGKETYKYARKWIAGNFVKVWILHFDSDLRTGAGTSNIFLSQQGRLLLIGIAKHKKSNEEFSLSYGSIADLSRSDKLKWLQTEKKNKKRLAFYTPVSLDDTYYRFLPSEAYDEKSYTRFWALHSTSATPKESECFIFHRHCSGIKLAPSSLFVHAHKPKLLRRSRDIDERSNLSPSAILEKWYKGQDKPPANEKFTLGVRKAFTQAVNHFGSEVTRYSYRPFLNPFALLSPDVLDELGKLKNTGTRPRPELRAAYKNSSTIGFGVAPDTEDLGEELHRFVSFCWYPPDNDLCKRGNSQIYCNLFPEYKKRKKWNNQPLSNINSHLLTKLSRLTKESTERTSERVVFYAYAILCSGVFLEKFRGALYRSKDSDASPRIPISADRKVFLQIAQFGEELANLEKADVTLRKSKVSTRRLKLFKSDFKLTSHSTDEVSETIKLCENGEVKISIGAVPRCVLNFQVAGYNVIGQWLKFYSNAYTRADFTKADFADFLWLLDRIEQQNAILKNIDSVVAELLKAGKPLILGDG